MYSSFTSIDVRSELTRRYQTESANWGEFAIKLVVMMFEFVLGTIESRWSFPSPRENLERGGLIRILLCRRHVQSRFNAYISFIPNWPLLPIPSFQTHTLASSTTIYTTMHIILGSNVNSRDSVTRMLNKHSPSQG